MAKAKKLPSGNWNVVIFTGKDSNGKRQYKSFTATTKKEVEFAAANYNLNQKQLSLPQNMTLKEAYNRYFASKSNLLSVSTLAEYKRMQKKYLQSLMPLKLVQLTPEKIQTAINEEAVSHSSKTVRNFHGLLSAVLKVYMPGLVLNTTLPQKIKPTTEIPTEKEINLLLKATEGKELHIAIILSSIGTLRRSEICALTSADVRDNGVMVDKAMVRDENNNWVVKQKTKTTAGKRFVELPDNVVKMLKEKEGRICNYVPNSITDNFIKTTKNVLGKHIRFHDLRHYSASILHALGVPDVYIMARGGWESRDTLNRIYTHVMNAEQEKFNKKIMKHFESELFDIKDNAK